MYACDPRRVSTSSPRCRPLGQSATQRGAHSPRLSEEDSSALRQTNLPLCLSKESVEKLYILLQWASDLRFRIPREYKEEFAVLPSLSNDLLGLLNFYFYAQKNRQRNLTAARSNRVPPPKNENKITFPLKNSTRLVGKNHPVSSVVDYLLLKARLK